jgi:hypothetical protein
MKMIYALAPLAMVVTFGALGGCATTDDAIGKDAGAQRDDCTLRVSACINSCHKADLGLGCRLCCERNGLSCDNDGGYSFYKCID